MNIANHGYGRRTANRSHRSFVPILEWSAAHFLWRATLDLFTDDSCDVLGHLHRGGGNSGHRLAIFPKHQSHITNSKDLRMFGQAEIGRDLYPAEAIAFNRQLL